MKSIVKIILLTALAVLFLVPAAAQDIPVKPDAPTIKPEIPTTPDKKPEETGDIAFPEVEGWEKGGIQRFPVAALGYAVNYESEAGGRVTIYVYDGGYEYISDSLTSKAAKGEIDRAKGEIKKVGEAGVYQDVKEVKTAETTLVGGAKGKVNALYAEFTFKARGRELISTIHIFPYQGNFIKIRHTRPKLADDKVGAEALAALLAEIDALFAK